MLNSLRIVDFHKYLVKNELITNPGQMHLNFVQDPVYLRIQILPDHLKLQLTDSYSEYANDLYKQGYKALGDNFIALVDFMNASDKTDKITEFKKYMQRYDSIRDENLCDVLPELAELYK